MATKSGLHGCPQRAGRGIIGGFRFPKFTLTNGGSVTSSLEFGQRPYVLLTGGTGLVGQYLVRSLLSAGQRVALVVRPSKKLTAQQRVESFMQRWEAEAGQPLARPVVLAGDISAPNLGLDDESQQWVELNCGRIIHSAAVLTFHGTDRSADPWHTNYGGTQHVVDMCERFDIQELHYISTAYVCGKRTDRVLETDLDRSQSFRNDYEHCKCEAEKLVQASSIASKTIYRPAVIVGDSKTGYTLTYHGLFMYLRLIATLVPQQEKNADGMIVTPISLPMSGDEPLNLVPVDWVADVVTNLFLRPETHGKVYHLTPDQCSTAREVLDCCCEFYGSTGVEFVGANAPRSGDGEFASMFFENATMYVDYETNDPTFDKSQLKAAAPDLTCPPIDREMVCRFIRYGTEDRWGKRRVKAPEVPFSMADQADSLARAAEEAFAGSDRAVLGIDLIGPGGGQWTIARRDDSKISIQPGLPGGEVRVVSSCTTKLIDEEGCARWQDLLAEAVMAHA